LAQTPATSTSLLLNLEGVFTLLIAWTVLRENVDLRLAIGAAAILGGAGILSWSDIGALPVGAAWIAAACLLWAVDNSLSRKLAAANPLQVTAIKGGVAGITNIALALAQGAHWPPTGAALGVMGVGALCYGCSIAFYLA